MTKEITGKNTSFSDMALNTIYIIDKNALAKSPQALDAKFTDYDDLLASLSLPPLPISFRMEKEENYKLKQKFVTASKADDLLCCYKFQKTGIDYYIVLNLTGQRDLLIINEQMTKEMYDKNILKLKNDAGKNVVAQLSQLHNITLRGFHLYYDKSQERFYCGCDTESYMYREELNRFFHDLLDFLVVNPLEQPNIRKNLQNNLSAAYNAKRNTILGNIAASTTTVNNFTYIDIYNEYLQKIEIATVYFDQANQHCIFSDGYEGIPIEELLRRSNNGKYYVDNHNRTSTYSSRMIPAADDFDNFIDKYYLQRDNIETTDYYYDSGLLIKDIGNKIKISFVADVEREKNTCTFFKNNILIDDQFQLKFKKLTKKANRLDTEHYKKVLNHYMVSIL